MHLPSLTDEELISLVRTKLDASELENEMAQRLAALIDQVAEHPDEIKALEDEIEELNNEITRLENEVDA